MAQKVIHIDRDQNGEIIMEDWLRLIDCVKPYIEKHATDISSEKIKNFCRANGVKISLEEAELLWDCIIREDDEFYTG